MPVVSSVKSTVKSAALKNVKLISRPLLGASTKPSASIGEAARNAKKKILPVKVVKTKPIKVARANLPAKVVAPVVDTLAKRSKIQTGSVRPPAPVHFGAPIVKRAPTRPKIALRLASGPSLAALRLNWLALKDRYGDSLNGMTPHYEIVGPKDHRRYRLIAGPLKSAARALSLCDHLNAGNILCSVSKLSGRRLK